MLYYTNSVKEAERIEKLIGTHENEVFTRDSWDALYQENSDFKGYLVFESGLIKTPVVQGQDNDKYLRKPFEGKYDTQGISYLDG